MNQINLLKKLGFTEYEAKAYLSLAKLKIATVREITIDSKLPRNKAYEALQKLEDKNKVVSLPVTPKRYKITNPETFKEEIKELNNSVTDLIKLINQPKITEFKDLFWILKGQKAILEKIRIQNTLTKKEIMACNHHPRILYNHLRIMKETIRRGVKVKMIIDYKKEKHNIYNAWAKIGVNFRAFNHDKFGPLLPRISVFDSKIARLTIGKPEVKGPEDYITLWTESQAFAKMLKNHLLHMWKYSKPIKL